MGFLSKVTKAVTKVAKAVTSPVKQAAKAVTNVVKSVSKPVVKAVSSVATGVKKVATNVVKGVAKAPAKVLGSVSSGIKKAATSALKSVGKVAAKVAVTAAKVSSKLGVAGQIIDVGLAAYTGGAYAAAKLAAKKVVTHLAASAVAKKLAPKSGLAASVASALISGGSTKLTALKQAALSATKSYAINKAGQQLAKKSNTLASAVNIYNGARSVVALGQQARAVSSNARQLGQLITPPSRTPMPAASRNTTRAAGGTATTYPLKPSSPIVIRPLPSTAGSYTVKKGDSLWAISSRTGVPVSELMKANGISNPNLVRPGTSLSIPATNSNTLSTTGNMAKGAGVGLTKVKIATIVYRPSPTTGKIGPDAKLKAEAKRLGIRTVIDPRPMEGGEAGKRFNNQNGSLAENELAKKQKNIFRQEAKRQVVYVDGKETSLTSRPTGSRVVDVQKSNWAGDIFESKVGATPYSKVQSQLKADADIVTKANGFSSKWSGAAKTAGKILKPIGLVTDGLRIYDAVKADGGSWGQQTNRTLAELGGGWSGAAGGAALGAAAGSAAPIVGTVVGAVVGGIAGAFGGEWLGGKSFDWLSPSATTPPTRPAANLLLAAPRSAPASLGWIDSKAMSPVTSTARSLSRLSTPATGRLASFGR